MPNAEGRKRHSPAQPPQLILHPGNELGVLARAGKREDFLERAGGFGHAPARQQQIREVQTFHSSGQQLKQEEE
jgi:hypothetical protein